MSKMKVEYRDIDEVFPYHNNPRKNDGAVEAVANSLREFGWQQPIVVDGDGTIIVGHTRLMAAKRLGMEKVPVVVASGLTPAQAQAYRVADNSTGGIAKWDWDRLQEELDGLSIDFDMTDFGISPDAFKLESLDFGNAGKDRGMYERECPSCGAVFDWGELDECPECGQSVADTDEYSEFVEKFKPKKTTDDCYTPERVYDAVADWVADEYGLDRSKFVRPFYPGGDFENEKYPEGSVVVDNPPFSLEVKIIRFYLERGIPFFIFAPTLTLFSGRNLDVCYVAANCDITYENGAKVNTSFVTNLDRENMVRTAPTLNAAVMEADKLVREEQAKPINLKYRYPSNVITAAMVANWSDYGVEFRVPKGHAYQVGALDAQKEYDKAIYGSGFLLSEKARAEAEKARALEAAKALGEDVEVEADGSVVWRLSERELGIVASLG